MDNMDVYQYEAYPYNEFEDDENSYLEHKKLCSSPATVTDIPNGNGSFDCNICLDSPRDPVVTLCGHLYCWPCIFKWLQSSTTSLTLERQLQRQCPVCKTEISETSVVPLYGRGDHSIETEPKDKDPVELDLPRRPPALGSRALIETSPNQQLHGGARDLQTEIHSVQNFVPSYTAASPVFNLGGSTTHPMIWMFGEMVYTRVFGNSTEVNLIGYPNSYHQHASSSPRIRRQEMKAERSLGRISVFLFCCIIMCLLLF